MLNAEQKRSLTETAERYANGINDQTLQYLNARGIDERVAGMSLLGSVHDPAPGHEHADGLMSIPYMTPTGVVGIKFRQVDPDRTPKYLWPTGQKVGAFNVVDLHIDSTIIAICEGELDTIVMSKIVGIPAVGVAGVSQWKPWFPNLFESYNRIIIFADNDVKENGTNPGMELAKRIKEDLDQAVVISLPANRDVNDCYQELGVGWLRERAGL